MPIYEYECTSCHHHFDLIQKINDEPVKICPECSKNSVIKLVSAAGFQLKGTGWYATDFKDKGKLAPTDKKDATSTTENSPSDTKSNDNSSTTKESSPAKEKATTKETTTANTTTSKGDS